MFHCMLSLQSIPKPFIVHAEQFVFWHLAPSQLLLYHSQGKHLISYIGYSHACFFSSLWEELSSNTWFVPKWMSISCMWLWFSKRAFKELSKEEWGKLVTTEEMSWCSWQDYQTLYFLLNSASRQSQSTAGWGQSWIAGTILSKIRHIVSQQIHITIQWWNVLSMHLEWSAVGLLISCQTWLFLVMKPRWKMNTKGYTLIGPLPFDCHLRH